MIAVWGSCFKNIFGKITTRWLSGSALKVSNFCVKFLEWMYVCTKAPFRPSVQGL